MVEVVSISSSVAERTGLGFFWGIWQSQKDQVLNKKACLKPGGSSQTRESLWSLQGSWLSDWVSMF